MSLSSEQVLRRAVQSEVSQPNPSCHCSPGATPCTPGPPNLAGIPRKHAEQALILRCVHE
eukprot:1143245-Pelagomonas_calceolata.AAC.5